VLGFAVVSSLSAAAPASHLRFVVLVARHAVRSPTWTIERLNRYSAEAWPDFGVPPGNLTSRGAELMKLFGAYDREYLAQAGLLHGACGDGNQVYFRADTDQRTLESARALAAGLLPGCPVEVHAQSDGKSDPLFSPLKALSVSGDGAHAVAAILGRLGENPKALADVFRPAIAVLERVLQKPLPSVPFAVEPAPDGHLAELRGPLSTASTLAEDLFLEYANGMACKQLGWGRLNASNLLEIMALHTAYAFLARRTLYLARANGSNLLCHIQASTRQAVKAALFPGAITKPDSRVLCIVGHDTNIANLAGMLGLSWLIPGYQRDDTPPGGGVSREDCTVRTYYMSQTLDQFREVRHLTLEFPPTKVNVFVPACSTSDDGFACHWSDFDRAVEAAIDPAFVVR